MSDVIRIEFANDKQVYAPGDTVLGNVVVSSQSDLNANGEFHQRCFNRINFYVTVTIRFLEFLACATNA